MASNVIHRQVYTLPIGDSLASLSDVLDFVVDAKIHAVFFFWR